MKRVQLLGTQRSGSNLLRLMLSTYEEVFAPPSAHELRDFQPLLPRYAPLESATNRLRLIRHMGELIDLNALPWPRLPEREGAVERSVCGRTLAHTVIAFYDAHARYQEKRIWVNKCLENVHLIDQLRSTGVPMLYLHLVRDPRDVALSFLRAPIGPKDPEAIALHWRRDQEVALSARNEMESHHWFTIRYEDLVTAPESTLRPLCESLGIRWSPHVLDFHRRADADRAATLSELWVNLNQPIRTDRISRYRASMDAAEQSIIEQYTCDLMPVFGYRPDLVTSPVIVSREEERAIFARDRKIRASLQSRRAPEKEAAHLRRLRFLAELGAGLA